MTTGAASNMLYDEKAGKDAQARADAFIAADLSPFSAHGIHNVAELDETAVAGSLFDRRHARLLIMLFLQ